LNPHLYVPFREIPSPKEIAGIYRETTDDIKAERDLHDKFEAWLRVHQNGPIPFVHSRMDRKSTIREGWPDFTVMFNGAAACRGPEQSPHSCCCIEFKMLGKSLSTEQEKCCDELALAGIPVRTCFSVVEAIEFCREKLGL
jgi:hypothetical protein